MRIGIAGAAVLVSLPGGQTGFLLFTMAFIFVMAFFAVFGYLCLKLDCEPAPLILGFVLGPLMEENMRRSLLISRGDPMVFLQEPISLAFLVASALLLLVVAAPAIRKKREEALQE